MPLLNVIRCDHARHNFFVKYPRNIWSCDYEFDSNTILWYYRIMNKKHQRTLEAIFKQPI